VRVRLGQKGKGPITGRILEVLEAGADRAVPPCRHFGACGGCALQHLTDDAYAGWKAGWLAETLRRADLPVDVIEPWRRSAPGSRRRADFTGVRRQQDVILGFNERGSHRVIDLEQCPVLLPQIAALMLPLRDFLMRQFKPGDTAEIKVQATDSGLDLLLVTPAKLGIGGRESLAVLAHDQDLARVSRGHPRQSGSETIVERRPVRAVFGGVPVALPPNTFLQPTAAGEAALQEIVLEATEGASLVADLYCGVGTFALPLAARGGEVFAADIGREAIECLTRAARQAGLTVTAEARNLDRQPVWAERLAGGDAVVFDPPRAGAKAQVVEIVAAAVPVVVAVSCNPSSFVRDAQALAEGGYRLERVVPVDQFLWSPHMELAAVFQRDS
jgi:23S rRNA (uracil1939-C5)-methyltransferase